MLTRERINVIRTRTARALEELELETLRPTPEWLDDMLGDVLLLLEHVDQMRHKIAHESGRLAELARR